MIDINSIKEIAQNKRNTLIEYYKKSFYKAWEKGIRKNAQRGYFIYSYTLSVGFS